MRTTGDRPARAASAAPGRSAKNSALASTRIDLRSGCGCDTIGAVASRLSENASSTARASGVPACAVYLTLRATSCTLLPTLRNTTIAGPPKRRDRLLVIEPARKRLSPRPWSRLVEKKYVLVELIGRDLDPDLVVLLPEAEQARAAPWRRG